MKVMVLVKATKSSEAGELPSEQLLSDMGAFNEELVKAGVMLAGEGLKPSSAGVRVRFSGKNRSTIDGPFAETKELLAGYWLWRVSSLDEAIEWVRRCPNPHEEECELEIRPVYEAEDFGDAFTPELLEQEAGVRAQTLGLGPVDYRDWKETRVAGVRRRYSAETRPSIPDHWARFVSRMNSVPGRVGGDSFGVTWNVAGCDFDYLTGVAIAESAEPPGDFDEIRLPAGRYAVFTHEGHISGIEETFTGVWGKWVPDCELKIADSPCFERYTPRFNGETGLGGVEIWIPLQA